MSAIKGQNLRVLVGGKCIAMSTSCTFHVSVSLDDESTKDSVGNFTEQTPNSISWDASTDSLVTLEDNGTNGELPQDILSLMIAGTPVTLTFDQTSGTNNRVGQNSAIKKTGTAYITDYSITAANRASSTLSVNFQGSGPLA